MSSVITQFCLFHCQSGESAYSSTNISYKSDAPIKRHILCLLVSHIYSDIRLLTPAHPAYCLQSPCNVWAHYRYVANESGDGSEEVPKEYENAVEFDYEADKRPAHEDE
jgi:hypothetical protein